MDANLTIKLFNPDNCTIMLGLSGSHAYGMAREQSDVDLRGICITPRWIRDSPFLSFDQWTTTDQKNFWGDVSQKGLESLQGRLGHDPFKNGPLDVAVYDLMKFVRLAAQNNPNVLELLFLDEDDILIAHALYDELRNKRELFLSKKCKHSYTGYAQGQLKRIKGHRSWLLNPPKKEPMREDFGLPKETVLPADIRNQVNEQVTKLVREWMVEDGIELHGAVQDVFRQRVESFYGALLECKEEALDETLYAVGAASLGITRDVLSALKQERKYRSARKSWEAYQKWKQERNPARAELEAKYGYDCYSSDTQFLTDGGWKFFDDVRAEDRLATLHVGRDMVHRKFGTVEYQEAVERFDGTFTGNLYHFKGHHTDILVTPNHRMLYRQVSRKKGETYGVVLEEAARLPDCFDFIRTVRPRTRKYTTQDEFLGIPIKDTAFLRLMGWYLSDGTAATKPKRGVTDIRVSQKKGGRLHGEMSKFQNKYGDLLNSTLYAYEKTNASGDLITEMVLCVRNKEIRERISQECGRTSHKRIPRWVFGLSRRMMEVLFDAMCGGDGTVRKTSKQSWIYYTSLKQLADDVNELALHCGWETSLWGPYKNPTDSNPEGAMYHVHIDKNANQFQRFVRRQVMEKVPVEDHRIVCFTVPNGTLITRRNGRVGIHGNSKHASHLVRLLRTGLEILRDQELRVKRPDAEELLAIRDGIWTYDELMEHTEDLQRQISEAYETSTLQYEPNLKQIDELTRGLLDRPITYEVR